MSANMEVDQDSGVFSLSLPDFPTQAEHATQWRVNGADHNDYAPSHRLRLEDYLTNVLGGVTTTNLQNTKISLLDATTLPDEIADPWLWRIEGSFLLLHNLATVARREIYSVRLARLVNALKKSSCDDKLFAALVKVSVSAQLSLLDSAMADDSSRVSADDEQHIKTFTGLRPSFINLSEANVSLHATGIALGQWQDSAPVSLQGSLNKTAPIEALLHDVSESKEGPPGGYSVRTGAYALKKDRYINTPPKTPLVITAETVGYDSLGRTQLVGAMPKQQGLATEFKRLYGSFRDPLVKCVYDAQGSLWMRRQCDAPVHVAVGNYHFEPLPTDKFACVVDHNLVREFLIRSFTQPHHFQDDDLLRRITNLTSAFVVFLARDDLIANGYSSMAELPVYVIIQNHSIVSLFFAHRRRVLRQWLVEVLLVRQTVPHRAPATFVESIANPPAKTHDSQMSIALRPSPSNDGVQTYGTPTSKDCYRLLQEGHELPPELEHDKDEVVSQLVHEIAEPLLRHLDSFSSGATLSICSKGRCFAFLYLDSESFDGIEVTLTAGPEYRVEKFDGSAKAWPSYMITLPQMASGEMRLSVAREAMKVRFRDTSVVVDDGFSYQPCVETSFQLAEFEEHFAHHFIEPADFLSKGVNQAAFTAARTKYVFGYRPGERRHRSADTDLYCYVQPHASTEAYFARQRRVLEQNQLTLNYMKELEAISLPSSVRATAYGTAEMRNSSQTRVAPSVGKGGIFGPVSLTIDRWYTFGRAYSQEGLGLYARGLYKDAIAYHMVHYNVACKLHDRRSQGIALGNKGNALLGMGLYQEAIKNHEIHSNICRELGDNTLQASACGNLAVAFCATGDYDRALASHNTQLDICKNITFDKAGEGKARGGLGNVYFALNQLDKAAKYHQEHAKICESLNDDAGASAAYCRVGNAYASMRGKDKLEKAKKYYEDYLALCERHRDPVGIAKAKGLLGVVYTREGNYQQAAQKHQELLASYHDARDEHGEAMSRGNLGVVEQLLKKLDPAKAHLEEAFRLFEDTRDVSNMAEAKCNYSNTHLEVSNVIYRALVDISRNPTDGSLLMSLDEFEADLPRSGSYPNNSMAPATRMYARDNMKFALRDFDEIRQKSSSQHTQITLLEHQAAPNGSLQAMKLRSSYSFYSIDIAERGRARTLADELREKFSPSTLQPRVETDMIEPWPEIEYDAQRGLELAKLRKTTIVTYSLIAERETVRERDDHYRLACFVCSPIFKYNACLRLNAVYGDATYTKGSQAFKAVAYPLQSQLCSLVSKPKPGFIRVKELLLDQVHGGSHALLEILGDGEEDAKKRVEDLTRSLKKPMQMADEPLDSVRSDDPFAGEPVLEEREGKYFERKIYMQRLVALINDTRRDLHVPTQDIQPPNFMLHLRRYGLEKFDWWLRDHLSCRDYVTFENTMKALVEAPEHLGVMIEEFPLSSDPEEAKILSEELTTCIEFVKNERRRLIGPLQQLYDLLIRPIASYLPPMGSNNPEGGDAPHLIIIPHSALYMCPFTALQDRNGTFLLERYAISMCPSLEVFDITCRIAEEKPAIHKNSHALALGASEPCQEAHTRSYEALPGAAEEAGMVGDLFKNQNTTLLIGEKATVSNVLDSLPKSAIVHLAAHGISDPSAAEWGLNGGLLLKDGVLRSKDIAKSNLQQGQLAVLSACSTGDGRLMLNNTLVIPSEGIMGLTRAFMLAGIPTSIVSLWTLDDQVSTSVMRKFYQELSDHPPVQALRLACLSLLNDPERRWRREPKHWAPYLIVGAPNDTLRVKSVKT